MSGFELVRPPVLAGAAVTRDELLRLDPTRQKEGWATARVVIIDPEGRTPVDWAAAPSADGPRLRTRAATDIAEAPPVDALLLGEADGIAYWGLRGGPEETASGTASATPGETPGDAAGDDPARWMNLYAVGAQLGALDAALMAGAVALVNWHDRARFCARDGSPTHPSNGGWARVCEAKGHEEYPRTDPAVICLVHDDADRLLLARQRTWPAGRYSVLAGFVEAGESLEACVTREIAEEVGIDVSDVGYLASQSWPFPRSLMIGFQAVADPEQPIRVDDTEISEAMWVRRDDLRAALARDDWAAADEPGAGERGPDEKGVSQIRLPGPMSIARTMIDSWAATH